MPHLRENLPNATAFLLPLCCRISWSRDVVNPAGDFITVKPLRFKTAFVCLQLLSASLLFLFVSFSSVYLSVCLLLFYSITTSKWMARETEVNTEKKKKKKKKIRGGKRRRRRHFIKTGVNDDNIYPVHCGEPCLSQATQQFAVRTVVENLS